MTILLIILAWYLVGISSIFLGSYIMKESITLGHLPHILVLSVLGPVITLVGAAFLCNDLIEKNRDKVLFDFGKKEAEKNFSEEFDPLKYIKMD